MWGVVLSKVGKLENKSSQLLLLLVWWRRLGAHTTPSEKGH